MAASQVIKPKFLFSFYNSSHHGRLHIEEPYLIKEHLCSQTHIPSARCFLSPHRKALFHFFKSKC